MVAGGDARSFELAFDRHADVAFSLAYRVCGRRELAERIVQDAFVALWRTRAGDDPAGRSVRSWILDAVHQRAIDVLRQVRAGERAARREQQLEPTAAQPACAPRARASGDSDTLRACRALAQLPTQEQRVIELAYFGGLTRRRIAQLLDLPDSAVAGSLRSGMQALHAALEADGRQARIVDGGQLPPADCGDPQQRRSSQPGDLALGQLG